jgi:hypothetical protein
VCVCVLLDCAWVCSSACFPVSPRLFRYRRSYSALLALVMLSSLSFRCLRCFFALLALVAPSWPYSRSRSFVSALIALLSLLFDVTGALFQLFSSYSRSRRRISFFSIFSGPHIGFTIRHSPLLFTFVVVFIRALSSSRQIILSFIFILRRRRSVFYSSYYSAVVFVVRLRHSSPHFFVDTVVFVFVSVLSILPLRLCLAALVYGMFEIRPCG